MNKNDGMQVLGTPVEEIERSIPQEVCKTGEQLRKEKGVTSAEFLHHQDQCDICRRQYAS